MPLTPDEEAELNQLKAEKAMAGRKSAPVEYSLPSVSPAFRGAGLLNLQPPPPPESSIHPGATIGEAIYQGGKRNDLATTPGSWLLRLTPIRRLLWLYSWNMVVTAPMLPPRWRRRFWKSISKSGT